MIGCIFHEGSGLGDQLFRYITVRTLAEEKGFGWEILHENPKGSFKGESFLDIGYNNVWKDKKAFSVLPTLQGKQFLEKEIRDSQGNDIRSYDPEINFVENNTVIDGSFEDDKYWRHNLDNISKWLAVEPLNVPDTTCIVGFRGGEYYVDPNLGLSEEYYIAAKTKLETAYHTPSNLHYQVHTDDPALAAKVLNGWEIIENQPISHSKHTNMGFNWRAMRYAKYAIISNSAFYTLPRILKHREDPNAVTIAPKYWARHNTKVWARPACYYPEFTYLHAEDTD